MARIRTIKPEFWTDERIVTLSPLTRLLFIGMWNFADDDGRMMYSPLTIKLQILPLESTDCSAELGELQRSGLITIYQVEDKKYLQINNFNKHQKVDRRTPSKIPPPSTNAQRILVESSVNPADGREGKGKEGKEESKQRVVSEAAREDSEKSSFQKIYEAGSAAYPNLAVANTSSIRQWIAAGCDPELDAIPEIQRHAKAGKPVRSWSYFTGGVMDSKATRESKPPKGTPNASTLRPAATLDRANKTERAKAAVMRAAEAGGFAPEPRSQNEAGEHALSVLSEP